MRRAHGITLVEVLVALAVLGLVVGAFTSTVVSSLRMNSDDRIRTRAIAAAEVWLDRFRAKSLDFTAFTGGREYSYGYDYAGDSTFVAAGDPDPSVLNQEWGPFRFRVQARSFSSSPQVWTVTVTTWYRKTGGGESSFVLSTLINQ
ncbi:type IV pilus modification PilV family protein [Thermus caldilimi]|uniref:type IV pilus modification PilV family protein n=1 Tax=Thermus caldilimi TaxID=2483360 RepID=UPI001075DF68|nr:prepilin-type N-terminal cleavage/methylation domain-containing protein [Thermus caldilimi]